MCQISTIAPSIGWDGLPVRLALRVVDGRFEGSYVDGAGSHALRCTVE